jgi:hypothetical protein
MCYWSRHSKCDSKCTLRILLVALGEWRPAPDQDGRRLCHRQSGRLRNKLTVWMQHVPVEPRFGCRLLSRTVEEAWIGIHCTFSVGYVCTSQGCTCNTMADSDCLHVVCKHVTAEVFGGSADDKIVGAADQGQQVSHLMGCK